MSLRKRFRNFAVVNCRAASKIKKKIVICLSNGQVGHSNRPQIAHGGMTYSSPSRDEHNVFSSVQGEKIGFWPRK